MSVRILLQITAAPGKSAELAAAYKKRCEEVIKEPGCLQFQAFQSVTDPHKFSVLEHWKDQAALDVHAALNKSKQSSVRGSLAVDAGQREDYIYNRTR